MWPYTFRTVLPHAQWECQSTVLHTPYNLTIGDPLPVSQIQNLTFRKSRNRLERVSITGGLSKCPGDLWCQATASYLFSSSADLPAEWPYAHGIQLMSHSMLLGRNRVNRVVKHLKPRSINSTSLFEVKLGVPFTLGYFYKYFILCCNGSQTRSGLPSFRRTSTVLLHMYFWNCVEWNIGKCRIICTRQI